MKTPAVEKKCLCTGKHIYTQLVVVFFSFFSSFLQRFDNDFCVCSVCSFNIHANMHISLMCKKYSNTQTFLYCNKSSAHNYQGRSTDVFAYYLISILNCFIMTKWQQVWRQWIIDMYFSHCNQLPKVNYFCSKSKFNLQF